MMSDPLFTGLRVIVSVMSLLLERTSSVTIVNCFYSFASVFFLFQKPLDPDFKVRDLAFSWRGIVDIFDESKAERITYLLCSLELISYDFVLRRREKTNKVAFVHSRAEQDIECNVLRFYLQNAFIKFSKSSENPQISQNEPSYVL